MFLCGITSGSCFRGLSSFIWSDMVSGTGFCVSMFILFYQLNPGKKDEKVARCCNDMDSSERENNRKMCRGFLVFAEVTVYRK